MDKDKFDFMEVRPKDKGLYLVTIYIFKHPEKYIKDELEYDGKKWLYKEYKEAYVCFIYKKI